MPTHSSASIEYDAAALEAAAERLGARMVVLFGSFATGSPPPGPDSDIDLALSLQPGTAPPGHLRLIGALEPAFPGRNLDPVLLAGADPLFRWEIMEPGRLLYGDPLDFLEYRAFAYRDFVDSADLRALERTLFEKRMAYVRGIVRGAA
jgi:uncharacterized protein